MDNREEIRYFEELGKIKKTFSADLEDFIKSIIAHYGNWKRYPRKTKKLLKSTWLWNLRNCNTEDLRIMTR